MSSDEYALYFSILIKIIVTISSISLICCFSIIILFLSRKRLRTFVCELLFHMAISEIFNSIAKILSLYKLFWEDGLEKALLEQTSIYCVFQRLLGNYSDFSTFFLMIIISYTLYDIMFKRNRNVKKCIHLFRILFYLGPALISSAISFLQIDETPYKLIEEKNSDISFQCYCWIPRRHYIIAFVVYVFYWIFIFINLYIICKTTYFLKELINNSSTIDIPSTTQTQSCSNDTDFSGKVTPVRSLLINNLENDNNLKIQKVIKKLYYYPIVTIIIWFLATISRTYELILFSRFSNNDEISDTLKIIRIILYTLQVIVMSGRGIIYSLLYFMRYENIRHEVYYIWNSFIACICCKNLPPKSLKEIDVNGTQSY